MEPCEKAHTVYTLNTISCSSRYPPQVYVPTTKAKTTHSICTQQTVEVKVNSKDDIPHQVVKQLYPDKPTAQEKFIVCENKPNQWILTVPLEHNNEIIYVDMFGDSGADCNGIQEDWAIADFDNEIQTTTQSAFIDTPGGIVESNRFINLAFKRKHDNVKWTARFYLLPDIPLGLLGGKNLLESFGFVFPDGIPNCFKHPEELELDMQLAMEPTFKPLYNRQNCTRMYVMCKASRDPTIANNTSMINKLFIGNDTIYDYSINGNENLSYYHAKENQQRQIINHSRIYNATNSKEKGSPGPQDTKNKKPKTNIINNPTTNNKQQPPANTTPLATTNNINNSKNKQFDINNSDVKTLIGIRELKFPDYSYIKKVHSDELYNEFMELLEEFDDIFAKHQYHRRDLAITPVKLGLRKEA